MSYEDGWFFHDHAWRLLHEIIKRIPEDAVNILDFGAGSGIASAIIQAVYPDKNFHLVDVEGYNYDLWVKRNLKGAIIRDEKDCLKNFKDNSFDCVLCSHVLEHVADTGSVIQELFRVVKKRILLIVPDGEVPDPTHKHIFDRRNFKDLIEMSLRDKEYQFDYFPIYHLHINNLFAVIDK